MLTSAQLTTLKTAMLADGNLTAMLAANDVSGISNYYNGVGTGFIWRPSVTTTELNNTITWSEFAGYSVSLQNAYMAMTQGGTVDATSATIRGGFQTIFGAGTSFNALVALAKKTPTKFEALYVTSNVCDLYGYVVSANEIDIARKS